MYVMVSLQEPCTAEHKDKSYTQLFFLWVDPAISPSAPCPMDGLVQDCSNLNVLAMELLQSCTKLLKYPLREVKQLWYDICAF